LYVLFAVLFARCGIVPADQSISPGAVKGIHVGFNNHYKLGCWTPVAVTLDVDLPSDARLEIEAPDADAVPTRFVGSFEARANEPSVAYALIGRPDGPIDVLLSHPSGMSPSTREVLRSLAGENVPTAVGATGELIVEMGASVGLAELFRRADQPDTERTGVVTISKPHPLPDRWYGYDGVETRAVRWPGSCLASTSTRCRFPASARSKASPAPTSGSMRARHVWC
jgi:hypothetical protein